MKNLLLKTLILSLLLCTSPVMAKNWNNWVQNLRQEAISQGIRPQLFDQIFHNMQPSKTHIHLDRTQPETRLTYYKYRNTRGDNYRIVIGRRKYKKYKNIIDTIGHKYGVDPCFIVTLWGLESSYGHYLGNFNVIRSLATLAYDGRRSAFFRKELLLALHMLNDGQIDYKDFKGEWAGASGQCQFLPSSWYKYAVDYNGDGRKDIWKNLPDAFASIANYLASNGWQAYKPVLVTVTLPANFNRSLLTLKHQQSVRSWLAMGVRVNADQKMPDGSWSASIIKPYGGPTMMVFKNFRALMSWNYSSFYAGTVNYVAQQICRR